MSEELSSLENTIDTLAAKPLRVEGDMGEVEGRSLQELIAWHKYKASLEVATNTRKTSGIRFTKLVPPGAV